MTAQKIIADFLKRSVDDISCELLLGGSEEGALVKCTHLDNHYVIKFFSNNEFGKNEIAWTKHASDLHIGPKLYYADPAGTYMIIEFVVGDSLVPALANTPIIIKNISQSVARLHSSCAPFAHASDMFSRIDLKYKKLTCSNKLKEVLARGMECVEKIQVQLPDFNVPLAPCHNDLNPGNIFVHQNHVTLIDWGDAALGNPYYDIAAFFILNVITKENETLFFEKYDKKLLEPQWQAYMRLCKQVVYFEFALNLLLGAQSGNPELLHEQCIPEGNNLNDYLTRLAERNVKIDSTFLYNMANASLREMGLI